MYFSLTASDIVISLIFLIGIYMYTTSILQKYINKAHYFKYFQKALFIRIAAGMFFS